MVKAVSFASAQYKRPALPTLIKPNAPTWVNRPGLSDKQHVVAIGGGGVHGATKVGKPGAGETESAVHWSPVKASFEDHGVVDFVDAMDMVAAFAIEKAEKGDEIVLPFPAPVYRFEGEGFDRIRMPDNIKDRWSGTVPAKFAREEFDAEWIDVAGYLRETYAEVAEKELTITLAHDSWPAMNWMQLPAMQGPIRDLIEEKGAGGADVRIGGYFGGTGMGAARGMADLQHPGALEGNIEFGQIAHEWDAAKPYLTEDWIKLIEDSGALQLATRREAFLAAGNEKNNLTMLVNHALKWLDEGNTFGLTHPGTDQLELENDALLARYREKSRRGESIKYEDICEIAYSSNVSAESHNALSQMIIANNAAMAGVAFTNFANMKPGDKGGFEPLQATLGPKQTIFIRPSDGGYPDTYDRSLTLYNRFTGEQLATTTAAEYAKKADMIAPQFASAAELMELYNDAYPNTPLAFDGNLGVIRGGLTTA